MAGWNRADRVLLTAFLVFLAAVILRLMVRDVWFVRLLYVVSEAALVGGIADWFAVTALFKKPLGFPWHTAIIPRHRQNIVQATANMVQNEFLTVETLQAQLNQICLVDYLIQWVDNGHGKQLLGALVNRYLGVLVSQLDIQQLAAFIEQIVKNYLRQYDFATLVRIGLDWVLVNGKDRQLLDHLFNMALQEVCNPKLEQQLRDTFDHALYNKANKGLLERAGIWIGEKINAVNTDEAAHICYQSFIELLTELRDDPDHRLRVMITEYLQMTIEQIDHQPAWRQAIEQWKQQLVDNVNLQDLFYELIQLVIQQIKQPQLPANCYNTQTVTIGNKQSPLAAWLLARLDSYWQLFKSDSNSRRWAEGYLQRAVCRMIDRQHGLIGAIAMDALNKLTDRGLNDLIESKVGEDLQWIRINGSVVGGVVGFIIFICIQMVQSWG